MNRNKIISPIFMIALFATTTSYSENNIDLQDQAVQIRKQIEAGPPQFSLIGKIDKGNRTDYSVNNEDFIVDSTTRITGELEIGSIGTIRGERIGGRNYAKKITIDQALETESPKINEQERLAEAPILGDGPQPLKLP